MAVLALQRVAKRFADRVGVEDLSLTLDAGEILGFLGPNGAGKTTTIRLLTGFLQPGSGTVHLLGQDMSRPAQSREARRRLGYVPDVAGLDPGMTGRRLLDELAALQGSAAPDRQKLLHLLELSPGDLDRPMGRLSRGTCQKINIVQGLQHRPDLLILDEPTEGLDPLTKHALFGLLTEAREQGAAVFFSSHILSEVEALCDRVALIRAGRLIAVSRLEDLQRRLLRRCSLTLGEPQPPDVGRQLAALPDIAGLTQKGERWRFSVAQTEPLVRLLAGWPVRDLTIESPSLESVFLDLYRPEQGM